MKQLKMTPERFSAFVEEYSRRLEGLRGIPPSDVPGQIAQGSFRLPEGPGRQGGPLVDRRLAGAAGIERLSPDEVRKLFERRAAKVAPEYRKQVEAYFRAISEEGGRATAATAPAR